MDGKLNHTTIHFKKESSELSPQAEKREQRLELRTRTRTLNLLIINHEKYKKITFLCSKKMYSSMKLNINKFLKHYT